jgi:hypothetical protein
VIFIPRYIKHGFYLVLWFSGIICPSGENAAKVRETTHTLRAVPDFRLLTNHGNLLLLLARDPRLRIRDMATYLDITERAAQRIVADLVSTGYLDREREGRRNVYRVRSHLPLRLPFQRDLDIKSLLAIMATTDEASDSERRGESRQSTGVQQLAEPAS